jgi:hypothetical protein
MTVMQTSVVYEYITCQEMHGKKVTQPFKKRKRITKRKTKSVQEARGKSHKNATPNAFITNIYSIKANPREKISMFL